MITKLFVNICLHLYGTRRQVVVPGQSETWQLANNDKHRLLLKDKTITKYITLSFYLFLTPTP